MRCSFGFPNSDFLFLGFLVFQFSSDDNCASCTILYVRTHPLGTAAAERRRPTRSWTASLVRSCTLESECHLHCLPHSPLPADSASRVCPARSKLPEASVHRLYWTKLDFTYCTVLYRIIPYSTVLDRVLPHRVLIHACPALPYRTRGQRPLPINRPLLLHYPTGFDFQLWKLIKLRHPASPHCSRMKSWARLTWPMSSPPWRLLLIRSRFAMSNMPWSKLMTWKRKIFFSISRSAMRLFRKDWTEEAECWCIGRWSMHWIRFFCLIKLALCFRHSFIPHTRSRRIGFLLCLVHWDEQNGKEGPVWDHCPHNAYICLRTSPVIVEQHSMGVVPLYLRLYIIQNLLQRCCSVDEVFAQGCFPREVSLFLPFPSRSFYSF